jgi:hypothetical protein
MEKNLRRWQSQFRVEEVGEIYEIRPNVFSITGSMQKVIGEMTYTQQMYESEFDNFQKAKWGVTNFEDAVEGLIHYSISLAVSYCLEEKDYPVGVKLIPAGVIQNET